MSIVDRATQDLITVKDPSLSLEARVAAGARLWDLIKRAQEALVPLKTDLRNKALESVSFGSTTFDGEGMTRAVVTVPHPSLQVIKGTNMEALKQVLTPSAFDAIFEQVTTYKVKADAAVRIRKLPNKEQSAVFTVVQEVENKPRVSFQFGGADILDMPTTDSESGSTET